MAKTTKKTVEERLTALERKVAELQHIVGDLKEAIEERVEG